jgi:hypothetical protein
MASSTLTTLVSGLFDYAGLFPPAGLDMQKSVEHYARARMGEHAWMLGRIVCPVTKLHRLSEAAAVMMPGTYGTSGYREHADVLEPWGVSAVVDCPLEEALELAAAFDEHHAEEHHGLAGVEALELRVRAPDEIDAALDEIPEGVMPFFEFAAEGDVRGFVAALAGNDAAAKIRCGGVTPEAIPTSEQVADFLIACRAAGVPFKATAGLHHPVRAEHPLTYEPGGPRGVMHGFVNVFFAAALAWNTHPSREELVELLEERDPGAFTPGGESAAWRDCVLNASEISRSRERFALSIGSCSFDEPVKDLQGLGWLA